MNEEPEIIEKMFKMSSENQKFFEIQKKLDTIKELNNKIQNNGR